MESSAITRNMLQLLEQYKRLRGKSAEQSDSRIWDIVVITTADSAQREAYHQQIQDKYSRSELPLHPTIHVVSDPPGPRIGNGGSTLTALEFLQSEYGDAMYQHKILMIHAGGWSQRMPSATILGKVFAAIPHGEPLYQMLDLKLAMYLPLLPHLPPGIFLVSADDFLLYDLGKEVDWSIPSSGFTALAHPSPISLGRGHGVYVVKDVEQLDTKKPAVIAQCLEVLQKPSDERMKSRGALLKSHNGQFEFADGIRLEGEVVYTDSCFYFGVDVMKRLLKLKQDLGTVACEIDAYGDFLQALGTNATDAYIYNTANVSQVTSDLMQVRKQVFEAMHGCDIHLLLMNASRYVHVGTTKELIHHFCLDHTFQSQMALKKDVFNCWLSGGFDCDKTDNNAKINEFDFSSNSTHLDYESSQDHSHFSDKSADCEDSQGCVMHSVLKRSSSIAAASVVEYCHFEVPVVVEENAIVSNCQWLKSSGDLTSPLVVPSNIFLHTVSLLHQGSPYYVTVFFNIADNLKTSVPVSNLTSLPFLGTTVGSALKHWQLSEIVVLPSQAKNTKVTDISVVTEVKVGEVSKVNEVNEISEVNNTNKVTEVGEVKVSLWTLKLYPGASTMTDSLELALDMASCVRNEHPLSGHFHHDEHVFFSLSDALALKDVGTMLNFRRTLFDQIQSR